MATAYLFSPGAVSSPPNPLGVFKWRLFKKTASLLYEATENELKGSGMTIMKTSTRVFKVTDFEIIVCPQTSTLNSKLKIDGNYMNIYIEAHDHGFQTHVL
jgi:hypothetical protein